MAKVYVSSTLDDLRDERRAVIDSLIKHDHQPLHSYTPSSDGLAQSCRDDIERCDVYLLILGDRYGYVPPAGNPERLSITHLEYRHAVQERKRCLVVLRAPDPGAGDAGDEQLKAFRAEAGAAGRPGMFSNLHELVDAVSAGLAREIRRLEPVPKPELHLPQHPIVVRENLIALFLARLDQTPPRRDFAFLRLGGVGKTSAAAQLALDAAVVERFPDGVLWAHLGKTPNLRLQLTKWANALRISEQQVSACGDRPAELSRLVGAAIGDRHMLLIVDDVWSFEDAEHFMVGGEHCARVFTTRHKGLAGELVLPGGLLHEICTFDEEEAASLLSQFAPEAQKADPVAFRQLAKRAGGLPIALVLIGNMLKKHDDAKGIRKVVQALDKGSALYESRMPSEFIEEDADGTLGNRSLGEAIEASYTSLGESGELNNDDLPGDVLRNALEALSVLRPDPIPFAAALAARVSEAPEQALDDLCDAGMIEEIESADDDDADDRRFTMHRLFAEYIREKVPDERKNELRRRAADYYLESLRRLEEHYQAGGPTAYAGWYRYEDAEWLESQDNWLYYLAHAGGGAEADLAFLRAWFDGFWWWGCFTDEGFDFCDRLLRGLDQRLRSPARGAVASAAPPNAERLSGLELLRRFKAAYPKETESRASGAWPEVVAALRGIRRLAGIDEEEPRSLDGDKRHVRAMTAIFLAEAARFGEKKPDIAEKHYREALALFRETGDDWNSAWVGYHLADMLCDARRYADARALCREALPLGHGESDPEVIANLHRVLGDIAKGEGDLDAAVRDYHRAVVDAYRFQVDPEEMPDAYTVQFYAEVAETVAGRLLPLRSSDAGREAIGNLRAMWTPAVEPPTDAAIADATTAERLAALLFAPTLPVARIDSDGAQYADRVRRHLAALGEPQP